MSSIRSFMMNTIQSINPFKKEELRATSTDCSDRKPTVEKKVESLASSSSEARAHLEESEARAHLEEAVNCYFKANKYSKGVTECSDLAANHFRLSRDAYQKDEDRKEAKEAADFHKLKATAHMENGDNRMAVHYYQSAAHYYLGSGNDIEAGDCYRLAADAYAKKYAKGGS